MDFGLLGEITVNSGRVDIGHIRQRYVLAALLVEANQVVPVDALMERVWGETLPYPTKSTLYSYVSRLRQALAEVGEVTIARRSGGYLLTVDPALVDVHRFRDLVRQARAAPDDERGSALFDAALGLWRGEPFAGLDTPWFDGVRRTLEAERVAAVLDRTDLRLRRGDHAVLLPGLADLVAAHPFDERLAGQYMLALHRGGRTTESLAHYDQISATMLAETGGEPGPELRGLRRRILRADQTLTVRAVAPIPRHLPAVPRSFVGRRAELARLTAELDSTAPQRTLVISAIGGMGGVGKTWLALHWAHHNLDRFPDGQLFVNLRGFDPVDPPTPSAVAVRGFLEALGVAPEGIPHEPGNQVNLYRSLLAEKRMLVVLDNAADLAQVEPLLPGGSRCTVIVTSRNQLVGLVAGHGAGSVPLGTLSDAEARELLTRQIGPERAAAEPDAVAQLVANCGGQPLALGVVAARIAVSPQLPLTAYAAELHDATTRLDALETSALGTSVRAVFTTSDRALSPGAAEVFRLLGLAVGPDIGLDAVVSLAGAPTGRVRMLLRELVSAHLVVEHRPNRYRMHDLVRLYAAERARTDLSTELRDLALRRLVDFYLHTADAADRLLAPIRLRIPLEPATAGSAPLALTDHPAAALAWFDDERACLIASADIARDRGWDDRAWQLCWAMNSFHLQRGHRHESLSTSLLGFAAARRRGDPYAVVAAHRQLGQAYDRLGQHELAAEHLEQALTLAEKAGDVLELAHTHRLLAVATERRGDDRLALTHAEQALRLFDEAGATLRARRMLNSVGWLLAKLGRYAEARTHCEQGLAFDREQGDLPGMAITLDSLGFIAHRLGEYAVALDHYAEALALMREVEMDYIQAETTERFAEMHADAGNRDLAIDTWRQALELYQAQGMADGVERVRNRLASGTGSAEPAVGAGN
ncbi:AfsR/SARP family transcriptional regulator [Plantactinospora soyae]|uniref:DNA-binding SARP family transcriptional activator/tetratricopeptide (TPR) repeat protein n=1 Tax=Plantactinospora soyae TaxID=1544732 RepID=A0A927M327_9ACTN|nr:BTAD domain-containing putative transcriptional regulator [Plantactinospora soyae]MBE1487104.1 DNA-binding SARP family transcriptional activator/tetratricopeptide (TPR) repeat protein [Plantactinospora soyae]